MQDVRVGAEGWAASGGAGRGGCTDTRAAKAGRYAGKVVRITFRGVCRDP